MSATASRRLTPEARRRQLIDVALACCARDGWEALSLETVAAGADVTRGLLYRYFPAGREDLLAAIADESCRRLHDGFSTDPDVELADKTAANFRFILEHAAQPSDTWLVYRAAAGSDLPEVRRRVGALRDEFVAAIATNNLGTPSPPPLARLAIRSYIAFLERAVDDWRDRGDITRDELLALLTSVFAATLASARS